MLFGLEWIQREIHNFGGDPRKVTLIGHSSGALSVVEVCKFTTVRRRIDNFQIILTPLSAGLFHQAAQMSAPYKGGRNENVCSKYSQRFAIRANCASDGQQFSDVKTVEKVISQHIKYSNPRSSSVWEANPGRSCTRCKTVSKMTSNSLMGSGLTADPEYGSLLSISQCFKVFSGDYSALLKQSLPKMNFMIGTTSAESKNTR